MKTTNAEEWHNPENVPDDKIPQGWRFMRKGENDGRWAGIARFLNSPNGYWVDIDRAGDGDGQHITYIVPQEKYQNLDPKGEAGKLKPQLQLIPPVLLVETAKAYSQGAKDYGAWNWRINKVEYMTYLGAMKRHIDQVIDRVDEGDIDTKSLCHHLGAVAASCGIVLDAQQQGTLVDNRPPNNRNNQIVRQAMEVRDTAEAHIKCMECETQSTDEKVDSIKKPDQLIDEAVSRYFKNSVACKTTGHQIDGTGICPRCQEIIP